MSGASWPPIVSPIGHSGTMRFRSICGSLTLLAGGLLPATSAAAAACPTARPGDLNGDGYTDLVVTEYGHTRLQGGIHVFYGTASGLTADPAGSAPDDQFLTQDSPGVPDSSEDADEWGAALAVGDFNADRCADVAVAAPGENGTAGAVTVLYGSPGGLTTSGAQHIVQGTFGLPDAPEANDRFGAALTTGDFNGDSAADLAIGAPGERLGKAFGAGSIAVLWGAPGGLGTGPLSTARRQGDSVAGDKAEDSDAFGAALAAGDLTLDGRDELLVGIPGENGAGAIEIFPGSPAGLKAGRVVDRSAAGLPGQPTLGDAFGAAVAAADFDGDGRSDIAVGIPGLGRSRGAVAVLRADQERLVDDAEQWVQGADGLAGVGAAGDRFGAVLVAGNLNGGTFADLAIGVPGDRVGDVPSAGAVQVLLGSGQGLQAKGSLLLSQATTGVGGDPTTGDRFGAALAIRAITGGGPARLVVGAPAEGAPGTNNHRGGAFTVFGASERGPTGTGSQFWALGRPGVQGEPARGTFLGYALG